MIAAALRRWLGGDRSAERAALAAAFETEIATLLREADAARNIDTAERYERAWLADPRQVDRDVIARFLPPGVSALEDCPVFKAHHGDVHLLGRAAPAVEAFYADLFAARSTVVAAQQGLFADLGDEEVLAHGLVAVDRLRSAVRGGTHRALPALRRIAERHRKLARRS